jgi:hypothetical protein
VARVTHFGGQALGRVLREHPGLLHLLVGHCGLTGDADDEAGADTADDVAAGLRVCTRLTHLDLTMNFRTGGMEVIAPTLGGLRALMELRLQGCRVADGQQLAAALVQCQALRLVELSECGLREGLLHATWPQLPALEDLDVGFNSGEDEEVRALAEALPRCVRLRRVRLAHNCVGEAATAELALALPLCVRLVNLDVRRCQHVQQLGFVLVGMQFVQLQPAALATLRAAWLAPNAGGVARRAAWLQV